MNSRLGHYNLQRSIGKGAMGEVFLAEDTRLERRVALKILPPEVAGSAERLARFKREAKAAAAISHPGIVTMHAIEEASDETGQTVHFLTMELVDGKTLSDCVDPEGLPIRTILDWGVQLADALGAAHAEGIIHRDLKPANVMVTASDSADAGRLKILDFGLARPASPTETVDGTESPTADEILTREGRILGTPAYMSPEQADGDALDHRSDIFSLGVILYELACGRRPFQGKSPSSVISAILRDDPPSLADLRPDLPQDLVKIVRRCLHRDRDRRFQTAKDVRNELDELREEIASGVNIRSATASQSSDSRVGEDGRLPASLRSTGIVAAAVIALGASIWWLAVDHDNTAVAVQTESSNATRVTDLRGQEMFPNLTSDGKTLVFAHKQSGSWGIFRQRIGGTKSIELTADHAGDDTMPALSPNDELIAFRSDRDGGGIFVMGATGESVRRVSDFGYNPSWSPDSRRLVFATAPTIDIPMHPPDAALWVVDVVHGKPEQVVGAVGAMPAWSPNGYRIAYYAMRPSRRRDIVTIAAEGGEPVSATEHSDDSFSPAWSADGRYLYYRKGSTPGSRGFSRVAVDEKTGRVTGTFSTVTETTAGWHFHMSIAGNVAAYAVLNQRAAIEAAPLNAEPGHTSTPPRVLFRDTEDTFLFDCSPDGSTLLAIGSGSEWRLFSMRTDGTDRQVLATGRVFHPRWSPDGSKIAVAWNKTGKYEIYTMRRDGSDLHAVTKNSQESARYPIWSPDGRRLAYYDQQTDQIYTVDPAVEAAVRTVREPLPGSEHLYPCDWSPDGAKLLTGHSTDGVVVLDLTTGERRRITETGGHARWIGDTAVAYWDDNELYRVELKTGAISPLLPDSGPGEHDRAFAISPGADLVYYTRSDRQYDIWTVNLPR